MTNKIKNAIYRLIDTRDYKYSHFSFTDDTGKAFDLAIRSLQAWSEVLTELEEEREEILNSNDYESEIVNYCLFNFDKAIDIINKHLAEIEEVR